jgi:hypothetical protein
MKGWADCRRLHSVCPRQGLPAGFPTPPAPGVQPKPSPLFSQPQPAPSLTPWAQVMGRHNNPEGVPPTGACT